MEERSMSKRLAITISGAVSLGCFEAGVLYEVLSAIKQHNQHDDTRKNPNESIEVDVLTGASAGGMTATIAAQKLMFDASALDGAYQNSFYGPWVLDVDMEGLLALQNSEDPTHSILSSDFVESISRKYLTQRYQAQTLPAATRHAAAADRIRLGLALSNLNGVNYTKPTLPREASTTRNIRISSVKELKQTVTGRTSGSPCATPPSPVARFPLRFP
jgi:predicted acylesterase/phospholipase RssA